MKSPKLEKLEEKLEYKFNKPEYLKTAVTHSSCANELGKGVSSNERQEFLGDAVLSIVVSDYLFKRYHLAEGDLTKLRASLVCEKSLCEFATQIDLGSFLLLGRGEEHTGGRKRPSILADAFEAVIAAIYLDGGIKAAGDFVLPFIIAQLDEESTGVFRDYKTLLQEIVQQNPEENVQYILVDESGPDHDKCFTVEVHLNSNVIGCGKGKSKKSAEQMAAKEALALMGK